MKVLALETAGAACSVAVWDDAIIAARFLSIGRGHAELLAPMIAEVLAEAGISAAEVDRLAVTVGPGAFTGLRVGLATARGLALASNTPLVGITTFEALAHAVPAEERAGRTLLVVVESRRSELFLQRFDAALIPIGAPLVLTAEACAATLPAGPLLVAGDGALHLRAALADRAETLFAAGQGQASAAVVARIAATLPAGAGLPPRPLYLRAPDAKLSCPKS